jgi:hypothetical protein
VKDGPARWLLRGSNVLCSYSGTTIDNDMVRCILLQIRGDRHKLEDAGTRRRGNGSWLIYLAPSCSHLHCPLGLGRYTEPRTKMHVTPRVTHGYLVRPDGPVNSFYLF